MDPLTLLLIDGGPRGGDLVGASLSAALRSSGRVEQVRTLDRGLERLAQAEFDVVVLDVGAGTGPGWRGVEQVLRLVPGQAVVALTDGSDDLLAAEALRAGAQDSVVKGRVSPDGLARRLGYAVSRQRALNDLRRERASALDAKDRFLSRVSHELRTPLTSVIGFVEMLRDGDAGPLTADQADLLSVVDRSAHRLADLIEHVLTLSRLDSDTYLMQMRPTLLEPLLRSCCREHRDRFASTGRELRVEIAGGLLPVSADERALALVFDELLSNAERFTGPGCTVTLTAAPTRDGARITVEDDGTGIPPEKLPYVFDRARGHDDADDLADGAGIGLCIVKSIVARHGGTVDLASAPQVGTRVWCTLPTISPRGAEDPRDS